MFTKKEVGKLCLKEFDPFFNLCCTHGFETLGQGTDKKGFKRGLHLGRWVNLEFPVDHLTLRSSPIYLLIGNFLLSIWQTWLANWSNDQFVYNEHTD